MHNERCMSGSARGHAKPAAARPPRRAWPTRPYIRIVNGFVYLAVILDLFSRRVIGWAISKHIDAELALTALRQAIQARRPPAGCIHHSDRGVQPGFNWSSQQWLCWQSVARH